MNRVRRRRGLWRRIAALLAGAGWMTLAGVMFQLHRAPGFGLVVTFAALAAFMACAITAVLGPRLRFTRDAPGPLRQARWALFFVGSAGACVAPWFAGARYGDVAAHLTGILALISFYSIVSVTAMWRVMRRASLKRRTDVRLAVEFPYLLAWAALLCLGACGLTLFATSPWIGGLLIIESGATAVSIAMRDGNQARSVQ